MHPEMVKRGYSSPYSAALPAVAGTLGIIIPPSIVFVIYGNITGTSISQLLMAGVVPGVLCAAALCVLAYIAAMKLTRCFPGGDWGNPSCDPFLRC